MGTDAIQQIKLYEPSLPQQLALDIVYIDKPFITCLKFGRQTGKSYLALMDMINRGMNATKPLKLRFVVPVYSLAVNHMQTIDALFAGMEDIKAMIFKKIRYKEQELHFHNGTIAKFLSAESEDGLRGDTAHFMYIDEAAFIKETTYTEILLPMLTRTKGRVLMFSTPNGKNWFYDVYNDGLDSENKDVISLAADYRNLSAQSDYESILKTINAMKRAMTNSAFNREVLGEFVSDQSLFTGVEHATYTGDWLDKYLKGLNVIESGVKVNATERYIGIDIGVVHDYTVLTLIDSNGVVLEVDRFNMNVEKYNDVQFKTRIKEFIIKHDEGLVAAYMEVNNKELLFEELSNISELYKLMPISTTLKNKPIMVDRLISRFDKGSIKIPNIKQLHKELYAFTSVQNKTTGKWQYKGSIGIHDDMVMSLVIAVTCMVEEGSSGYTETY